MLKKLPREILDSHVAVLGKTGVGKSGGIRASIIEPMLDAGERICCIDPTDTQWGIRLTPDGRPSKYNVIVFGGNHGDRPLNAHEGEAIGEAVGTSSSSVIISTKKMRPRERTLFFTDFAEALLRTNNGILHLVIDEAHLFAPQAGGMGLGKEAAAMLHATNDLVSLGRGAGLCIVLATQRPAKIHKDSVSQCETLIAMRMSHPLDQAAIEDWIGLKRIKRMKTLPPEYLERAEKIMGGVQFLADRNAYVWAPDPKINVFDQIAFPTYKTFDSGERNKASAKMTLAPIDLTALEGKLKQVAEEARANDPAELQKQIVALKIELAKKPATVTQISERVVIESDPAELQKADRGGFQRGKNWGISAGHADEARDAEVFLRDAEEHLRDLAGDIASRRSRLTEMIAVHRGEMDKIEAQQSGSAGVSTPAAPTRAAPPAAQRRATSSPAMPSGDDTFNGPTKRLLASLAFWASVNNAEPSRSQVAFVAGYSPKSSGFEKALSAAKTAGLVSYPNGGLVALTEEGGANASPMSAEDAKRAIVSVLTNPQRIITDTLISVRGPISREQLAAETNYSDKSSGYEKVLSQLNTLGIAFYPSGGHVQITDWARELLA